MRLPEARRLVAREVAGHCRKLADHLEKENGLLSEPERAHLRRAYRDVAKQMDAKSR